MRITRETIPWAMTAGRAALGPLVIAGERCGWSGMALAAMVITALLSDIFDGVLARRWRCDTAGVRLFDSMCDVVFYACVAGALWIEQPRIWHQNAALLGVVLALEAANFSVAFMKFGKPASYHSWLAKTWGLVLTAAAFAAFATGHGSMLTSLALGLGIACNLENLAMSFVLPVWRKDIKNLRRAWEVRAELGGIELRGTELGTIAPNAFVGKRRLHPAAIPVVSAQRSPAAPGAVTLFVLAMMSASAFAAQPGKTIYSGGTAGVPTYTAGTFDTASPTALQFEYRKKDKTAGQIDMPYESIRGIEPRDETAHPLGILPFIAVSLVAHPPRRYFLTINYADAAGLAQVAVFEVSKRDQPLLVSIVNARSPRNCVVNRFPCPAPLVKR